MGGTNRIWVYARSCVSASQQQLSCILDQRNRGKVEKILVGSQKKIPLFHPIYVSMILLHLSSYIQDYVNELQEVKLPYDPVCPLGGRLVYWSVCHNFQRRSGKFHFSFVEVQGVQ